MGYAKQGFVVLSTLRGRDSKGRLSRALVGRMVLKSDEGRLGGGRKESVEWEIFGWGKMKGSGRS